MSITIDYNTSPSKVAILEGIRERYSATDLPDLVWSVLESDAVAPLSGGANPFYKLQQASYFGAPKFQVKEIRAFASALAVCDIEDSGHIASARERIYRELGLELPTQTPADPSVTTANLIIPSLEWGRGEPGKPGPGLQSRRRWTIELYACKTVKVGTTALGAAVIEPSVSVDNGEFWLSLDRMSELTGHVKSGLAEKRTELVREGWLVDTGKRKGNGTVVYRIAIPSGCEKCGPHDRTLSLPLRVV